LKRLYAVVQKGCSIILYPSSQLKNILMPTICGSPFMQSAKVVLAFLAKFSGSACKAGRKGTDLSQLYWCAVKILLTHRLPTIVT